MLSICTPRSFTLSDTCISSNFGGSAMILFILCFEEMNIALFLER